MSPLHLLEEFMEVPHTHTHRERERERAQGQLNGRVRDVVA